MSLPSNERTVLEMSLEKGKTVTCHSPDRRTVALIFWRKNSAPLLPLDLSIADAKMLRDMLSDAISEATP